MGGWKLEVFKMGVYMTFPVGLFYYFNQPSFFEDWMMEKRNQLFPPQEVNAVYFLNPLCDKLEGMVNARGISLDYVRIDTRKERINKTIDYLEKRKEEQARASKTT